MSSMAGDVERHRDRIGRLHEADGGQLVAVRPRWHLEADADALLVDRPDARDRDRLLIRRRAGGDQRVDPSPARVALLDRDTVRHRAGGEEQKGGHRRPMHRSSAADYRWQRVRCRHDEDRLRLHARAVPPDRPARLGRAGRGRRIRRGLPGQRALPSLDAAAGAVGLRVVVHGRPRTAHEASVRHRRHLPWLPLPPRRDRPRGGDPRRDVSRALLARPRGRRGAERARDRRRVAGGRHPLGDDVRGDRGHHQALQRQGREARRRLLHARIGPALHPA